MRKAVQYLSILTNRTVNLDVKTGNKIQRFFCMSKTVQFSKVYLHRTVDLDVKSAQYSSVLP